MDKLNRKRMIRAKRTSARLARLPFVQAVILNGSLAIGQSKPSSDIDILIIARDGRIFTARFLVLLYAIIFNIKRSSNREKPHSGKYCFNYFLTESFLTIPVGRSDKIDRYCAENYSRSIFMAGDIDHFNNFMAENRELYKQAAGSRQSAVNLNPPNANRSIEPEPFSPGGSEDKPQTAYRLLLTDFGDWLELKLKNFQIKKIKSDPITARYPDLIVFNDHELRFHPPKGDNQ